MGVAALQRFIAKCRFDATTGCVLWIGGTTSGRGHSAPYGAFWYEGRRWFAHRWAAKFIHGHDIEGLQVDHYCPHRLKPHTLCVEHVRPLEAQINRDLQTSRQRQYWLLVTRGYEEPPEHGNDLDGGIPFYYPPAWLKEK